MGVCGRKIVGGSTFAEVIEHMFERCSVEEVEVQVEVTRQIWFRWNTMVHREDFLHPNVVVLAASTLIDEYKKGMDIDGMMSVTDALQATTIPVWWQAPPPGIYKINWDATLDSKKRKLGFGLIVWDSNGHVHAATSYSMDVWVEPVVAKALAALRAAKFCRSRGLERINLEGDSLQVVHALNKPRSN